MKYRWVSTTSVPVPQPVQAQAYLWLSRNNARQPNIDQRCHVNCPLIPLIVTSIVYKVSPRNIAIWLRYTLKTARKLLETARNCWKNAIAVFACSAAKPQYFLVKLSKQYSWQLGEQLLRWSMLGCRAFFARKPQISLNWYWLRYWYLCGTDSSIVFCPVWMPSFIL